MIVIYHNPESSDSNACLKILETHKHDHEVIKYQDKPLDKIKLVKIINILNIKPEELIRKESKIWVENFKHLEDDGHLFNDDSLIVINGEKAVIGKPAKRIFDIIPQQKATL